MCNVRTSAMQRPLHFAQLQGFSAGKLRNDTEMRTTKRTLRATFIHFRSVPEVPHRQGLDPPPCLRKLRTSKKRNCFRLRVMLLRSLKDDKSVFMSLTRESQYSFWSRLATHAQVLFKKYGSIQNKIEPDVASKLYGGPVVP